MEKIQPVGHSVDRPGHWQNRPGDAQRPRPWRAVALSLGAAFALAIGLANLSTAQAEPIVTDPDTNFYRVYIVGSGDSSAENSALSADLNTFKAALERQGNQKSLNSLSAINPSLSLLEQFVDNVRNNALPGDAVTIFFSGRGNVDTFRLRSGVNVSAADLASMLTGFDPDVTRVIIMDSCFGGSFVDDLEATGGPDEVMVIGTSTTCPFDAPFDAFIQTFPEDLAAQAGQGLADTDTGDGDGVVTGDELETALLGLGWKLGEAGAGDEIQNGKSKCDGVCDVPMIMVTPPECAATVDIDGIGFAAASAVDVLMVDADLFETVADTTFSYPDRMFSVSSVSVPAAPTLVVAEDAQDNLDWHFCENGGADPPPVDDMAPSCHLDLVGDVIEGTFQDVLSGLAEIKVTSARNVSVDIDGFDVGTTGQVMSEALINNTTRSARVRYRVTDVSGNYTICSKYVSRRSRSRSWSW